MTELPPLYGYVVCKKNLDDFFDTPYVVMYGHNAIDVYIQALNMDIVLVHIEMRAHD